MPTHIPSSFSHYRVTKVQAMEGTIFVWPQPGYRYRITSPIQGTQYADESNVRWIVRELVNSLGGPIPYMPGPLPSDYESAEQVVANLLEDATPPPSGMEHDPSEANPLDPDSPDMIRQFTRSTFEPTDIQKRMAVALTQKLIDRNWRQIRVELGDEPTVQAEIIDVDYRTRWEFMAHARVAPAPDMDTEETKLFLAKTMRQLKIAAKRAGLRLINPKFESVKPAHGAVDVRQWARQEDFEDQTGDWRVCITFSFDLLDQFVNKPVRPTEPY